MTEAQHTQKFIRSLKNAHPEWMIIKFNDRTTKGIPDMCVSNGVRTLWLECKVSAGRKTVIQRYVLDRLGGKYLIFGSTSQYIQNPWEDTYLSDDPMRYIRLYLAGRAL